MVDGHDHEEQKKHSAYLTSEYTTAIEPQCHHWVKMPVAEFNKLPDRQEIMNAGYTYTGINITPMIELHVDDHPCLQEWANNKYGNVCGNISVRVTNQNPIIIFGQDESVFSQFSFGRNQWVDASGERALLPKSKRMGIMALAFKSQYFGFNMELTADD